MKALGTGHTQEVLWRDVEVVRHGGPAVVGGRRRGERFEAMGGGTSLLTITHSETVALAPVLLHRTLTTGVSVHLRRAHPRSPPPPNARRRHPPSTTCRPPRYVTDGIARVSGVVVSVFQKPTRRGASHGSQNHAE